MSSEERGERREERGQFGGFLNSLNLNKALARDIDAKGVVREKTMVMFGVHSSLQFVLEQLFHKFCKSPAVVVPAECQFQFLAVGNATQYKDFFVCRGVLSSIYDVE